MPTFIPPNVSYGMDNVPRLFQSYKMGHGMTVLKLADGTYVTREYPSQDEVAEAAVAYLGGHIYTVTTAEALSLLAAGYFVDLQDPPGFGEGGFGTGGFGI